MSRATFKEVQGHTARVIGPLAGYYHFGCSCGWTSRVRNRNALARTSAMVGEFNRHAEAARAALARLERP